MHGFFRLRVEGGETLPQPPFLLCPNHVSYLDPFALAAALTRRQLGSTYWAGWTGLLFTSPLRRLFSRAAHVIPIDPDRAAAAGIALGSAVLARGHALVWFPEGALSPDGSLQRFQPGVGALVDQHPVPVVPVLITGTEVAFPPGQTISSSGSHHRPLRATDRTSCRGGGHQRPAARSADCRCHPRWGRGPRRQDCDRQPAAAILTHINDRPRAPLTSASLSRFTGSAGLDELRKR